MIISGLTESLLSSDVGPKITTIFFSKKPWRVQNTHTRTQTHSYDLLLQTQSVFVQQWFTAVKHTHICKYKHSDNWEDDEIFRIVSLLTSRGLHLCCFGARFVQDNFWQSLPLFLFLFCISFSSYHLISFSFSFTYYFTSLSPFFLLPFSHHHLPYLPSLSFSWPWLYLQLCLYWQNLPHGYVYYNKRFVNIISQLDQNSDKI